MRAPGHGKSGESAVTLSGRLDATSAAATRELLHGALDEASDQQSAGTLVVDMSAVYLIDATGVGVLVGAHRRASLADRELVLRGVQPGLVRMLCRAGLWRVLHRAHHSGAAPQDRPTARSIPA